MDIRSNFKDGEEFVRGVMENEHVRYIRGRVGKVFPVNDRLIVRAEDTLMGIPLEIEADLVVLATAMVPVKSPNTLVSKVGGKVDGNGFITSVPLAQSANPMEVAKGVYYADACGFPCDVRELLNQGSAAAAGAEAIVVACPLCYLNLEFRLHAQGTNIPVVFFTQLF